MRLYRLRQTMASLLEVQNFVRVDRLLLSGERTLPSLTFGVEALDNLLTLNFGQFVVFQGKPSHPLCMLLCVRAMLPCPLGPNSDVIFIDGGNSLSLLYIRQFSWTGARPRKGSGAIPHKQGVHSSSTCTHHNGQASSCHKEIQGETRRSVRHNAAVL